MGLPPRSFPNTSVTTCFKDVSLTDSTADSPEEEFEIIVSTGSDVGCTRKINEDRVQFFKSPDVEISQQKGLLAIVADGMGGHRAGEVASQLAVDEITKNYYQIDGHEMEALEESFRLANAAIYAASSSDQKLSGMGTTCTALVIRDHRTYCVHVGDCRLYRVRLGEIECLTEDHTLVQEWVVTGLISHEEARDHPNKNIITRSMGTDPDVEFDSFGPNPMESGDSYVLCSDGLYDFVDDDEIATTVSTSPGEKSCAQLIALAKDRGGFDNISIIVVECRAQGAIAQE